MNIVHIILASVIAVGTTLGAFGFLGPGSIFTLQPAPTPKTAEVEKPPESTVVQKRSHVSFEEFLTDPSGKTLYTTTKESCVDACLENWPPYLVEGEYRANGKLSVVFRDDILRAQYTWDGKPLYYYAGDMNPGEVNGHQKNGIWFVAKP